VWVLGSVLRYMEEEEGLASIEIEMREELRLLSVLVFLLWLAFGLP
jgi:hypothetical protein